jgi:hypothetical protein
LHAAKQEGAAPSITAFNIMLANNTMEISPEEDRRRAMAI